MKKSMEQFENQCKKRFYIKRNHFYYKAINKSQRQSIIHSQPRKSSK